MTTVTADTSRALTDSVKSEIAHYSEKIQNFEYFLTHDIPERGVHAYFHKSYCTDRAYADMVIGMCSWHSDVYIGSEKTDIPYKQFVDDIFYHEDNMNVHANPHLKKHYIEFVTVMLPRRMPKEEVPDYIEYLADKMTEGHTCTWFWGVRSQDGVKFVDMFFSEREYFPAGTIIKEYYKNNIYQDKYTGKNVKADHPNAIIKRRKGEVKTSFTAKFGNKALLFRQTSGMFKRWRKKMQQYITAYVREYDYDDDTFLLPRADYNKCPNKYIIFIAHEFNKRMQKLEEKANEVRRNFEEYGIQYSYKEFSRLLKEVKAILYKGSASVRYNNHVYNVNVSIVQKYKPFVAGMDLLEKKYDEMLRRAAALACNPQMRC